MKFRAGDNVVIKKIADDFNTHEYGKGQIESVIGSTGKIISFDYKNEYPYKVEFDDPDIELLDLNLWKEEELELLYHPTGYDNLLWDEVAYIVGNLNIRNLNADSLKDLKEVLETKLEEIKGEMGINS